MTGSIFHKNPYHIMESLTRVRFQLRVLSVALTLQTPVEFQFIIKKFHDDVIKWKHFSRCWPFVRGIQPPPVDSPHTGQWRRALMFSLICAWTTSWANNRSAGHLRRHRAHYDVTVMLHAIAELREYTTSYGWRLPMLNSAGCHVYLPGNTYPIF